MASTRHMLTLWAMKTSRANKRDADREQIKRERERQTYANRQTGTGNVGAFIGHSLPFFPFHAVSIVFVIITNFGLG